MALQLNNNSGVPEIRVLGRFDFTSSREFREVCKQVGKVDQCIVDMQTATYVDSSALGMMLLLREQVDTVKITGATPQVRKVFEIANFQKLFDLD